jgi:hypothetical protein
MSNLLEIKREIMALPLKDRAELAEYLLASLDDLAGQENEALWIEEAERRYQSYLNGAVSARTAADVLHDARERLG